MSSDILSFFFLLLTRCTDSVHLQRGLRTVHSWSGAILGRRGIQDHMDETVVSGAGSHQSALHQMVRTPVPTKANKKTEIFLFSKLKWRGRYGNLPPTLPVFHSFAIIFLFYENVVAQVRRRWDQRLLQRGRSSCGEWARSTYRPYSRQSGHVDQAIHHLRSTARAGPCLWHSAVALHFSKTRFPPR